eukprot:1310710-Pyramimonas_sp.AAC.1
MVFQRWNRVGVLPPEGGFQPGPRDAPGQQVQRHSGREEVGLHRPDGQASGHRPRPAGEGEVDEVCRREPRQLPGPLRGGEEQSHRGSRSHHRDGVSSYDGEDHQ